MYYYPCYPLSCLPLQALSIWSTRSDGAIRPMAPKKEIGTFRNLDTLQDLLEEWLPNARRTPEGVPFLDLFLEVDDHWAREVTGFIKGYHAREGKMVCKM